MKGTDLYLGIELGSTRIKAALIDGDFKVISGGSYAWENKFENGWWTYSLEDVITGLRESFSALKKDYALKTGSVLKRVSAIGVSAMMHGYLVFDSQGRLLTPFRTWRNARTQRAPDELTELFGVRVPQRWSVSNLYQCILDGEEHVSRIARLTTLAGWVHSLLTGRNEVGVCEASGMFPVTGSDYDSRALELFCGVAAKYGFNKDLRSVLPQVRPAGAEGACLTKEGALLLDPEGDLAPGIPVCPPEGDAGTGMTATNSVRPGTGSISAGTSVFALIVNGKPLSRVYREAEVLKTPDGSEVALLHSNNGCSEIDRWIDIFGEFAALCGNKIEKPGLYDLLYKHTVNAAPDCGGAAAFNCASAEPVLGIETGYPMIIQKIRQSFNSCGSDTRSAMRHIRPAYGWSVGTQGKRGRLPRPDHRSRRTVQGARRSSADLGGRLRSRSFRHGIRRRGRSLRNGSAGGLYDRKGRQESG